MNQLRKRRADKHAGALGLGQRVAAGAHLKQRRAVRKVRVVMRGADQHGTGDARVLLLKPVAQRDTEAQIVLPVVVWLAYADDGHDLGDPASRPLQPPAGI